MDKTLKTIITNFIEISFFALVAFVFLLKSPLHPWISAHSATDSSVFQTVALMMQRGYVPYLDTFDHKGPLVYLINYVGMLFGKDGIWFLEYICLIITSVVMYKISKVFNITYIQSVVAVFLSFSLLFKYFDGGNLVEEWAMPFIAIGLYIYVDYIYNGKISRLRLLVCGLCFGCVCMIRANMVVVWLVFAVAIFVRCIYKKEFEDLKKFVAWFIIGFGICIIPLFMWLAIKGGLQQFWFSYIEFNIQYISFSEGTSIFSKQWKAFFSYANTYAYIIAIMSALFLCSKKNCFLHGICSICLILTLCSVALSGNLYPHYGMILVPLIIPAISGLFAYFNEESGQFAGALLIGIMACNVFSNDWIPLLENIIITYDERTEEHRESDILEICDIINTYTVEDDPISVYGNFDIVYVASNRPHATKYSYQFPVSSVCPNIKLEYFRQLQEDAPKIIVVQQGYLDNMMQDFLYNNQYVLLWTKNKEKLSASHTVYILSDVLDGFAMNIDLSDVSRIKMSNAELIDNQFDGEDGIICKGSLQWHSKAFEMPIEEYIRTIEYIGFQFDVEDISEYNSLVFYGKKIRDHGQPCVYIYNQYGELLKQFTVGYGSIDNEWNQYSIDISELTGKVTIIFNGGYVDSSGSKDSSYVFSKVIFR